jgi:spermidine synthase
MAAGLMGAVLPLVAHFGIRPDDRAGKRLSYLYLSNILGSASGSLLTGFVLMQHLALGRISLLLLWLGLGLSALLLVGVRWPLRAGAFAAAVCLAALAEPYLHDGLFEKLLFKERWSEDKRFSRLVENRSGVIAVRSDGAMFGGGMYDGCANVDLVDNRNNIVRAYALAAMRDRFPDVLMVGLASGSWAQVIASTPGVDHLTVVEINPGYLGLVGEHAEVASLLTNPNVENVVDDGRRWLMAHPERRFDLIAQNTTWYWRGHASNLLSAEYLQIVKAHLKPGGVFYVNTNFSQAALKTACTSFAHGFGIFNVLAVSDDEVTMDRERWRRALVSWRIDGKVVLNLDDSRHRDRLASVLSIEPEPCSVLLGAAASSTIITDDNMAGEWSRPWWLMPESDKLVLPAAHTPP